MLKMELTDEPTDRSSSVIAQTVISTSSKLAGAMAMSYVQIVGQDANIQILFGLKQAPT